MVGLLVPPSVLITRPARVLLPKRLRVEVLPLRVTMLPALIEPAALSVTVAPLMIRPLAGVVEVIPVVGVVQLMLVLSVDTFVGARTLVEYWNAPVTPMGAMPRPGMYVAQSLVLITAQPPMMPFANPPPAVAVETPLI